MFLQKNGIKLVASLYTAIENSNEKQRLYQVLFYNAENLRDFSKAIAFPHPQQQEYATTVKNTLEKNWIDHCITFQLVERHGSKDIMLLTSLTKEIKARNFPYERASLFIGYDKNEVDKLSFR